MTVTFEVAPDEFDAVVAALIPTSPEPPRTAKAIAEEIGAAVGRVSRAVARIKDQYPHLPLTSSTRGYRWSANGDDLRAHATKEIKYVATRTRRSLLDGLLEPFLESHNSDQIHKARTRIEFILDDLAAARESVDAEWETE